MKRSSLPRGLHESPFVYVLGAAFLVVVLAAMISLPTSEDPVRPRRGRSSNAGAPQIDGGSSGRLSRPLKRALDRLEEEIRR